MYQQVQVLSTSTAYSGLRFLFLICQSVRKTAINVVVNANLIDDKNDILFL